MQTNSFRHSRRNSDFAGPGSISNPFRLVALGKIWLAALLTGTVQQLGAVTNQPPSFSDLATQAGFSITESGATRRTWTRVASVTNADGSISTHTNRIKQLGTGLNRWNGQAWIESTPQLIVTNGVVVGRGAQHSVIFASNLNSTNPIQIKDPAGNWIKGRPLCLAYHDISTGSNMYFAVIKDSTAQVIGNRVVYPDAFDGATASVSYTFSREGLSQDIRFQARPPGPEAFHMNPKSSSLLVISEFSQLPTPQVRDRSLPGMGGFKDQTITMGGMTMIPGRAFNASKTNRLAGVPVTKTFQVVNGRNLVVERVPHYRIRNDLLQLPTVATNVLAGVTNASISRPSRWVAQDTLPSPLPATSARSAAVRNMAFIPDSHDFVLDWQMVDGDGGDPYTFDCDTFLIDGNMYLENVACASASVVKFSTGSSLEIGNTFTWLGDAGCGGGPAYFVSVGNNGYGESIPGWSQWLGGDFTDLQFDNCDYVSTATQNIEIHDCTEGIITASPCLSSLSVVATDPVAVKGLAPADPGVFTITRADGDWSQELTVQFSPSGNATAGSDYDSDSSGSVSIPQWAPSATVTITPRGQTGLAFQRNVTLTIAPDPGYTVGDPSKANVFIQDPSATPTAVPVPQGMVGWWRAENDPSDFLHQTPDGALCNGAGYQAGLVGQSFTFDGNNQNVHIPDSSALHLTEGATIEAWVKPASVGDWHEIASKWGAVPGATVNSYTMGTYPDGRVYFGGSPTGSDEGAASVPLYTALVPGYWYHVAGTFDGGMLSIYLNGNLEQQLPIEGTLWASGLFPGTGDFGIGGAVGGGVGCPVVSPYDGQIDEVTVYNRPLSQAEIQAIADAGTAGKCGPPQITSQPTSQTVSGGASVTFSVGVSAASCPPTYQWFHNGAQIISATSSSLLLTAVHLADGGDYKVVLANSSGETVSSVATLTVQEVATPVFSPVGGSFASAQNVVITCSTPGATIRYTTDGNDPTPTTGTLIASGSSVLVDHNLTLKAQAYLNAWAASTVKPKATAPTARVWRPPSQFHHQTAPASWPPMMSKCLSRLRTPMGRFQKSNSSKTARKWQTPRIACCDTHWPKHSPAATPSPPAPSMTRAWSEPRRPRRSP